jgi:hypothetical protein
MTDAIKKTLSQILSAFGHSGINSNLELILIRETGSYINLNEVYSEIDLKRLCLVSVSRDCYKTQKYRYPSINNDFHKRNLDKLNKALGTNFTKDDMEIIYQHFGNGLNQDLAASFVVSGYDMNIFKEVE